MICTVIKCDRCGDEWNITRAGFNTAQFWKEYEDKNGYEIRLMKGHNQVVLCDKCNRAIERFLANNEG